MKKTFKYRIYPNKSQTTSLNKTLDGCRWLYNYFLDQRKQAWENNQKSITRYDQNSYLKQLKKEYPFLSNIFSQVLQDVSTRIDLAFRSFFRRIKFSSKPGYPRFKGKFRYDSFTYPQGGFKLLKNVIQLSKIGNIKTKLHLFIEGMIKTCTIKRTPTGKWFVTLVCDIDYKATQQSIKPIIGIDIGLINFATFSNSETIKKPRFIKKEE